MATDAPRPLPCMYLVWPRALLAGPLNYSVPAGYSIRPYREGDDEPIRQLLATEWPRDSDAHWKGYKDRILPNGLFVALDSRTNTIIATAGAVHNPVSGRYYFPFGGELGDMVVHPEHRGKKLGAAISAVVVRRFLAAGYENIWVCVQDARLPAAATYLKLGFVPFLHDESLAPRWAAVCGQLGWAYTPDEWPKTL